MYANILYNVEDLNLFLLETGDAEREMIEARVNERRRKISFFNTGNPREVTTAGAVVGFSN